VLPIGGIQQALYEALSVALAPVPVVDYAGPNQEYPYVTIGEFTGAHADTLAEQGADLELTVHVWSRQPGMQQTGALMEAAKDALHRQRFAVSGFQWVDTIWDYAQTLRDPDGKTRHGILRFRVMTFEQPT
jgi:hypothetical protein